MIQVDVELKPLEGSRLRFEGEYLSFGSFFCSHKGVIADVGADVENDRVGGKKAFPG